MSDIESPYKDWCIRVAGKVGSAIAEAVDKDWREGRLKPVYIDAESGKEVTEDWWPDVR